MVKKYADLYLDARRALLPTEGQNASNVARELLCAASGSNLYVEDIRTEQCGANTAVVCSLGTASPEEPWMHSAHANAIQVETEFLPGYDWGKGVLRLTLWPFMG